MTPDVSHGKKVTPDVSHGKNVTPDVYHGKNVTPGSYSSHDPFIFIRQIFGLIIVYLNRISGQKVIND